MAQSPLDSRLASLGLLLGAGMIGYSYYKSRQGVGPLAPPTPLPPGSRSDSGGGGTLGPQDQPGSANTLPWPPEVLREWSLPQSTQQQHHDAILNQFGVTP